MSLIDTRDRHPDIAELRRLLDILIVLATSFGAFSLIVGLDASDPGATRAGMLLVAAGLLFVLIRLRTDQVRVGVTVGATAATLVVAGITLTVAEPIYSVFAIVPLLAVGVALPYVRGRVLGTIMVVAWVVAFGINVLLETSTTVSLLSPEAQSVFRFGGFLGGSGSSSSSCGASAAACTPRLTRPRPPSARERTARPGTAPSWTGSPASSTCRRAGRTRRPIT